MQSPSFLAFQRMPGDRCGDSNTRILFGMKRIPCDNHIRQTLDGVLPEHFDDVLITMVPDLDRKGALRGMRRHNEVDHLRFRTCTGNPHPNPFSKPPNPGNDRGNRQTRIAGPELRALTRTDMWSLSYAARCAPASREVNECRRRLTR